MVLMGDIGTRIREARRTMNLSQADLAAAVGVSRPQVYKWESGRDKPSSDKVHPLCQALAIPTSYLLTGEDRAQAIFMQEQRLREIEAGKKKPPKEKEESDRLRREADEMTRDLANKPGEAWLQIMEKLSEIIRRLDEIEGRLPKKKQ